MPADAPLRGGGGGRRKPKPKPTSRGPQGLPIQSSSPQRPAPRPKPAPSRGPQGLSGPRQARPTPKVTRARTRQQVRENRARGVRGPQRLAGPRQARVSPVAERARARQLAAQLHALVGGGSSKYIVPGRGPGRAAIVVSRSGATSDKSGPLSAAEIRAEIEYQRWAKAHPGQAFAQVTAQRKREQAAKLAPVLSVLEQTTRPLHGVAGGVDAALHGRNVLRAAGRGFANKDKVTFGKVLRGLGVPKGIAGVAGFGLDVVLDPTTYVTGGTGSVLRREATQAAEKAASKALKQGLSKEQARRFGERAAQRVVKRGRAEGRDVRGVTVRVAGKELPGVRRATAKAGAKAGRASDRVRPVRALKQASRDAAATVNPGVVPAGLSRAEYEAIRQRTRTARHSISRGTYEAQQRARAVQKAIGAKNYQRVLDAIEAGEIKSLPAELRAPARFLRDQFKYVRRQQRRAGVKVPYRKNYVPHIRAADLEEDAARPMMGAASVGRRRVRPMSSKQRSVKGTLAELRDEHPGRYVEDPGVLFAGRMAEGNQAVVRAEFNRRLAETGRSLRRGRELEPQVRPGEAVYHVRGSDIREVKLDGDGRRELGAFLKGSGRRGGQYVVLNRQAVERALLTVVPGAERSKPGVWFDKAQGTWKLLATQPNPGFHVRNLAGDLQNAFAATRGHRMPANLHASARTLGALGRHERQLAHSLESRPVPKAGVISRKTGFRTERYGDIGYDRVARELVKAGAIRSGFQARELHDLLSTAGKVGKNRGATFRRWLNNREDFARASTAIDALKRGASFEEAAAHASRYHFDYSDLTDVERRILRRIFPFYTWSARNIPLQFKVMLSSPAKFAQYQKVREELAGAFGYEDKWEKDLQEYEQRAAPLPIVIDGHRYTISLGPSGLPLTDLNELPTSANPVAAADEWINKAMSLMSPAFKTPIELWSNFSFFFREQIERDEGPLVPAPSWVGSLPDPIRRDLGIVPDYVDRRSGKKGWAWPAKVGYTAGVLPGPFNFLNRVMTPSERVSSSAKNKVLGYMGIRARAVDPLTTGINRLYEEQAEIKKQRAALNQRGVNKENPSPEYDRLLAREKDVTDHIFALRTERGDKILPAGRSRPSGVLADPDVAKALERSKAQARKSRGALDDPEIAAALKRLRSSR